LGGGPPCFPRDSSCPVVLGLRPGSGPPFAYRALTSYGRPFQTASARLPFSREGRQSFPDRPQPQPHNGCRLLHAVGLGSSPFARRYSGNRCLFLFLGVLRCFSSPGSPRTPIDSACGVLRSGGRVPPFGHPRIDACLRLPEAFRSLPRPSSALGAKASTVCPCLLDLTVQFSMCSGLSAWWR
jgi:hypothetical protein